MALERRLMSPSQASGASNRRAARWRGSHTHELANLTSEALRELQPNLLSEEWKSNDDWQRRVTWCTVAPKQGLMRQWAAGRRRGPPRVRGADRAGVPVRQSA